MVLRQHGPPLVRPREEEGSDAVRGKHGFVTVASVCRGHLLLRAMTTCVRFLSTSTSWHPCPHFLIDAVGAMHEDPLPDFPVLGPVVRQTMSPTVPLELMSISFCASYCGTTNSAALAEVIARRLQLWEDRYAEKLRSGH